MIYTTHFTQSYPHLKIRANVSATVKDGQITRLDLAPLPGSRTLTKWAKQDIEASILRSYAYQLEQGQAN